MEFNELIQEINAMIEKYQDYRTAKFDGTLTMEEKIVAGHNVDLLKTVKRNLEKVVEVTPKAAPSEEYDYRVEAWWTGLSFENQRTLRAQFRVPENRLSIERMRYIYEEFQKF